MANARGKEIDNTHLSIDQAEERGFLHRDYIAHCLRWTHIAKYLQLKSRYKTASILDIGCGKDMPLAKMLMTSRLAPQYYLGVEYNKMEIPKMFEKTKFKPELISERDFSKTLLGDILHNTFNYSVCLEVLEHVEPITAIAILERIPRYITSDSISWFSTPCWDEKVGAAGNHVNEMTYEAFGSLLEEMGYKILNHWGTFASIKDYKHKLSLSLLDIFAALKEYYDSNYISTIFAPMFPDSSRNCLWETQYVGKLKLEERQFTQINQLEGRLGSSSQWRDLTKCIECARNYVKT